MRLMAPSPGEAYDRMTILTLKTKAAKKKDRQDLVLSFDLENNAINLYMLDKHYIVPTNIGEELAKINSRLWDLEDVQRKILREHWDIDHIENEMYFDMFARNAITITQLNDARAETVQKINAACQVNAPEKLYGE